MAQTEDKVVKLKVLKDSQDFVNNKVEDLKSAVADTNHVMRGDNIAQYALTVSGSIYSTGLDDDRSAQQSAYKRSDYIKIYNSDKIDFSGIDSNASHYVVAVYNSDLTIDSTLSVAASGAGTLKQGTVSVTHDGYVRFACGNSYISSSSIKIITEKNDTLTNLSTTVSSLSTTVSELSTDTTNLKNDLTHVGHAAISGSTYHQYLTVTGAVSYSTGADNDSSDYKRTAYIYFPKGTVLEEYGPVNPTGIVTLAVYNTSKAYQQSDSVRGDGTAQWFRFTMPHDGYVRFSTKSSALSNVVIRNITDEKTVNILVLGNSFAQDSFAYVPKVFGELGTDVNLNICIGYNGGASISSHSTSITNNDIYTKVSMWNPYTQRWDISNKNDTVTPATGTTATQMLAKRHWDIIYVQGNGSISSDANVRTNVVTPAKSLLRQLRTTLGYSFKYVTGQWLIEKSNNTSEQRTAAMALMKRAMELADSEVGFNGVWPIGTGIQNARTNSTLDALGTQGSMIYDNDGHQQAGLPALISAYVVVESLIKLLNIGKGSVYDSTFSPTDENCIAINASKADPTSAPLPLTHGTSVGVTNDNVFAAKQLAVISVRNPFVISDCSAILS